MSGYDGPRIITDGLVFCVDASDLNSFPQEPTVYTGSLKNLTNDINNVNLFGAGVNPPLPTVSGSVGTRNCGINTKFNTVTPFSFGYMTIQNMTTQLKQLLYSEHTIQLVCKINNLNSVYTYDNTLTTQNNGGLIIWNGYHSGLYISGTSLIYYIWNNTSGTGGVNTSTTISSYVGHPILITATRISNQYFLYINDVLKNSVTVTPSPNSYNYQNIQFGCAYAGNPTVNTYVWPSNTTFYGVKLYNRGFTINDVRQNYNVIKTKYNL